MVSDIKVGLIDAFTLRRAAMMLAKEKIDTVTRLSRVCAT